MDQYSYEDIIINPNSKQAQACIGKEVYFADTPNACLYYANTGNNAQCGILQKIKIDSFCPFVLEKNGSRQWGCIILKKEEEPEYIPFESADEFLNAYENSKYNVINVTTEKKLINCGGIWLKSKCEAIWITQCTEVTAHGIAFGHTRKIVLWKELLNGYRFLDSTPCGKKKKVNNE